MEGKSIRITMVVCSDLVTDQRVQRHADLLAKSGYTVTLIGRKKRSSLSFSSTSYKTIRLKSMFETGWIFYATYNMKLFFCLLFIKADIIWSNDLDTLLSCYLASKIKRKRLIYDSHEYYTGVPELQERPLIRAVWQRIERAILPRVKHAITVSYSVAQKYFKEYGVHFTVIRNMPLATTTRKKNDVFNVPLPQLPFILYQGALNKDRGLEELIEAFSFLEEYALVIAGKGDIEKSLYDLVHQLKLEDKVLFLGLLRPDQLRLFTPLAIAGISIEKPSNPNYEMCLPNKLFDYIQAHIPVIAYPHDEIRKIVDAYKCGAYIYSHEPKVLASQLKEILTSPEMSNWKKGSILASADLNWENESKVLLEWLRKSIDAR